jgi:hypothetical protein
MEHLENLLSQREQISGVRSEHEDRPSLDPEERARPLSER